MQFDLVIKNGAVIDGTGSSPKNLDIGISGDKIVFMGNNPLVPPFNKGGQGGITIDASGCIVSPGFIDIHSHSDFLWFVCPESESKVMDGVTTEICGNCGSSPFPLFGPLLERKRDGFRKYGLDIDWRTPEEFFERAVKTPSSINRGFLVGHGNIRACVIGYEDRYTSGWHELSKMKEMLRASLDAGALGMSSGLIYPPGCYAPVEELIELCEVVGKSDKIYTSHIRNEGDELEHAVKEALLIARESGVSLEISHIKTSGKQNWQKIGTLFELISSARREGVDVLCDRYPYIAAATDLDVVLPDWTYEGGSEQEIQRLKDQKTRKLIADEVMRRYPDEKFWEGVVISNVHNNDNKGLEGKSIAQIAGELKKSPIDTVFDILIEEHCRAWILLFSMCEENLEQILKWDFVMVGSDSSLRKTKGILSEGKPHPRSYGTFSKVLGTYCRDRGLFPFEKAIYKITGMPAQRLKLEKRGILKEGYFADIAIFDPKEVTDCATYKEPHQYSKGIEYVIVNGKITVGNGKHTGITKGTIIKK
ncbi:MAG TPA: N-acyl-D-amino-acid deacylase family protein [Candidatus Brocadiia bacterium]